MKGGRSIAIVVGVLVLGGIAGAWAWSQRERDDTEERRARIDVHRQAALAAAAKAYFVYPPPDDPTRPTAYTEVLAIEDLVPEVGVAATEAATELRTEFADTLVRLGDRYWDVDGGRPFAIDYYLAARMFDPDHERARERASMTPGELLDLRRRAETVDFSVDELVASEPLVALAEADEAERFRKLSAVEARGAIKGANLRRLLDAIDPRPRAAEPKPKPTPPPVEAPAAAEELAPDEPSRDPTRSRELVAQGLAEAKQGRRGQAEQSFHNALELDPRNAAALNGLSVVMFERGNYERARMYGKKAVALAPRNSEFRMQLGDAYAKTEHWGEAREQYGKADALGHREAKSRIAWVDARLGR